MNMSKRLVAEFIGTAWLVLGGCGSAVLAAAFPALGIGFAGVSLAGSTLARRSQRSGFLDRGDRARATLVSREATAAC